MAGASTDDVTHAMGSLLDPTVVANVDTYRDQFAASKPFKFIQIDNFLNESFLRRVQESFPHAQDRESLISDSGRRNAPKYVNQKVRDMGEAYVEWDDLISSPEFIGWVERITGIDGLLYDPTYRGAGVHENFSAIRQRVHIDYNYLPGTTLHRRLNLILFINPVWDPEWGGALRMLDDGFSHSASEVLLPCNENSCVLFETNEYSWHGVQTIEVPEGVDASRMSLTVYYYSEDRSADEVAPSHTTIYTPGTIIDDEARALVASNQSLDNYVRASSALLRKAQGDMYKQSAELTRLREERDQSALRKELGRLKRGVRGVARRVLK